MDWSERKPHKTRKFAQSREKFVTVVVKPLSSKPQTLCSVLPQSEQAFVKKFRFRSRDL